MLDKEVAGPLLRALNAVPGEVVHDDALLGTPFFWPFVCRVFETARRKAPWGVEHTTALVKGGWVTMNTLVIEELVGATRAALLPERVTAGVERSCVLRVREALGL